MTVMEMIAYALLIVSCVIWIGGGVWMLVEMFKTNIWWGLGGLICGGGAQLIWIILNWKRGWPPLVFGFGGFIPALIGLLILMVATAGKSSPGLF